jgi:hypothetical protein
VCLSSPYDRYGSTAAVGGQGIYSPFGRKAESGPSEGVGVRSVYARGHPDALELPELDQLQSKHIRFVSRDGDPVYLQSQKVSFRNNASALPQPADIVARSFTDPTRVRSHHSGRQGKKRLADRLENRTLDGIGARMTRFGVRQDKLAKDRR